MNKEYFLRKLTEKGKFKTPMYQNGEPVACWRSFKSEREAIDFIKEYELNDVMILMRYVQPKEDTLSYD
jgi:hypothetical protein